MTKEWDLTILRNIAHTTAIDAAVFLGFQDTAELLSDKVTLESVKVRGRVRRMASGDGEVVDEFEDEESRKGAAEVADAVEKVSLSNDSASMGGKLT